MYDVVAARKVNDAPTGTGFRLIHAVSECVIGETTNVGLFTVWPVFICELVSRYLTAGCCFDKVSLVPCDAIHSHSNECQNIRILNLLAIPMSRSGIPGGRFPFYETG